MSTDRDANGGRAITPPLIGRNEDNLGPIIHRFDENAAVQPVMRPLWRDEIGARDQVVASALAEGGFVVQPLVVHHDHCAIIGADTLQRVDHRNTVMAQGRGVGT
jgi:hypothetical protein